jgi:excisionase family DNA binding protein
MLEQVAAITIKDAAKALKVSERFIAKLIADRHLPSLKLGRRRLIREVALRDYLERQETVAR